MGNFLQKLAAKQDWILRIAIAFPMFWAGIRELMNPNDWIGFVPAWTTAIIPQETTLMIHAVSVIIIGLGLLAGFWRALFSAAATLTLLSIVVFYGLDDITFRDVGLILVAFVLFLRSVAKTKA